MSDGNKVLLEIQNTIALLTLNKPGRLNTLDVGLWEELKSAAEVLDANPQVRVAINAGWNQGLAEGLAVETFRAAEVLLSEDARIGRSAAAQRIEPSFKGR